MMPTNCAFNIFYISLIPESLTEAAPLKENEWLTNLQNQNQSTEVQVGGEQKQPSLSSLVKKEKKSR
jgi:hypothetical protein